MLHTLCSTSYFVYIVQYHRIDVNISISYLWNIGRYNMKVVS